MGQTIPAPSTEKTTVDFVLRKLGSEIYQGVFTFRNGEKITTNDALAAWWIFYEIAEDLTLKCREQILDLLDAWFQDNIEERYAAEVVSHVVSLSGELDQIAEHTRQILRWAKESGLPRPRIRFQRLVGPEFSFAFATIALGGTLEGLQVWLEQQKRAFHRIISKPNEAMNEPAEWSMERFKLIRHPKLDGPVARSRVRDARLKPFAAQDGSPAFVMTTPSTTSGYANWG